MIHPNIIMYKLNYSLIKLSPYPLHELTCLPHVFFYIWKPFSFWRHIVNFSTSVSSNLADFLDEVENDISLNFCVKNRSSITIKVLKYWKPGFNDWFSFLLLVLRHQESAIHRLGGYYYVHDPLNFYHRPYHDRNSVTCVHPNAWTFLWPVNRTCPGTTGIL